MGERVPPSRRRTLARARCARQMAPAVTSRVHGWAGPPPVARDRRRLGNRDRGNPLVDDVDQTRMHCIDDRYTAFFFHTAHTRFTRKTKHVFFPVARISSSIFLRFRRILFQSRFVKPVVHVVFHETKIITPYRVSENRYVNGCGAAVAPNMPR